MEKLVIDNKLDPGFKYEIAQKAGGENIKKCFACGTCTAGCPVFHVEHEYNPRKIIRMILLGLREQVLKSKIIWLCSQCYTCSANCPQDVDFSHIMFTLRDMAVKAGYASPSLPEKVENITTAAHELRRDLLNHLLGTGNITKDAIRMKAEKAFEMI
ncbi:MAG: 4Fe-4S dicluster domain-containing protein [Spirochaetota bacterium]